MSDGSYLFKRETNGTRGGKSLIFNGELMTYQEQNSEVLTQTCENYSPAVMDEPSFLWNDGKKFFKHNVPLDPKDSNIAMAISVFELYFTPHRVTTTINIDEAIDVMDKTRSPGYPWNLLYQTKQQVVDNEYDLLVLIISRILVGLEFSFEFAGHVFNHTFWQISGKNEIRSNSKLCNPTKTENKTRTFMCADIVTYIVGLMLYHHQNNAITDLGMKNNWSAIGIVLEYGGANWLAHHLLESDGMRSFSCDDIKGMEASLSPDIQGIIYNWRHGSVEWTFLQKWFFSQICFSYVIDIFGFLVMKIGKNPSGSFNTLSDNTLANIFRVIYVVVCNMRKENQNINAFEILEKIDTIHLKIMGDDSIAPVVPELQDNHLISQTLGFTVTAEVPDGPLWECSFLNKGFYFDMSHGMWVVVPNMEKLFANVYKNFKNRSWRNTLAKLNALYLMTYPFRDFNKQVSLLREWVYTHKKIQLENEDFELSKMTYKQAKSTQLTDAQCEFIVFGWE